VIEAYLSTTRVGWRVGAAATQWFDVADIGAALETLRTHHAAQDNRLLRVWLSARLAPPVILPPATGARSASEVAALVRHTYREAFPDSTDFTTWTALWKPGSALVAAAVERELLDTLRRMPNDTRSRWWSLRACGVLSIRPWWNIPWAIADGHPAAAGASFTLEEPDGLLFWRLLPGTSESSKAWVAHPPEELKTPQRRRFDATSPAGSPAAAHWCMGPGDGDLPIGSLSLIDGSAHELADAPR
jgi:hypothetical protein